MNTLVMSGGTAGSGMRQMITSTPDADGTSSRLIRTDDFGWTMNDLAALLSAKCAANRTDCLYLPVVNTTNIAGKWNFRLERSCESHDCEPWGDPLKKLGLTITKGTAPMDKLVIDQITRTPTDN